MQIWEAPLKQDENTEVGTIKKGAREEVVNHVKSDAC